MSFAHNTPIQFIPGIGSRTAKILHQFGVHTAGQLNRIPEQVLVELFGPSIRGILSTLHMPIRAAARRQPIISHTEKDATRSPFGRRLRLAAQLLTSI